ncbi:PREDICTED: uncharacterized protein LOC105458513 [Wasmannia auropunctata]|uniref:uncharacterized protein LOC105458513 n=1 Tax=Wasmannia auropunctata TaxID=64793 RepID=UPI0005F04BF6|nr:PREDICTED: uncharacterized protein LOC105458513 [Wasmannia auropunctata]
MAAQSALASGYISYMPLDVGPANRVLIQNASTRWHKRRQAHLAVTRHATDKNAWRINPIISTLPVTSTLAPQIVYTRGGTERLRPVVCGLGVRLGDHVPFHHSM